MIISNRIKDTCNDSRNYTTRFLQKNENPEGGTGDNEIIGEVRCDGHVIHTSSGVPAPLSIELRCAVMAGVLQGLEDWVKKNP